MFRPAEILQTRRFPGFAVFHRLVRDFRLLRCCESPCTRCYTGILTLDLYVDPTSRGMVIAASAPFPARNLRVYGHILKPYHTIRGM